MKKLLDANLDYYEIYDLKIILEILIDKGFSNITIEELLKQSQGEGDTGAVPDGIEGGLTSAAGAQDPAQVEAELLDGLCGIQVLCGSIGQVDHGVHIGIVANDAGIDISEYKQSAQNRQDNDVQLVAEEHTEHTVPVRITGRGDLFGIQRGVIHMGEELFIGHIEL